MALRLVRLAINGYGRIGRCVLRALYESGAHKTCKIVAINEPADPATIAYLTRYDSTHGHFPGTVAQDGNTLIVNGDRIALTAHKTLEALDWQQHDVDIVLECSGVFSSRKKAQAHLKVGAKKVLFSQPADQDIDAAVVCGINDEILKTEHTIASAASCTTNAIVPVIKVLDDAFGVVNGVITTIHSAMNDQPVLDGYHHTDLRKTRAALQSLIPIDTQLARGIERILPHLKNCFAAQACVCRRKMFPRWIYPCYCKSQSMWRRSIARCARLRKVRCKIFWVTPKSHSPPVISTTMRAPASSMPVKRVSAASW
jgi:D-erythrose 4-phosphate dehydrogenase